MTSSNAEDLDSSEEEEESVFLNGFNLIRSLQGTHEIHKALKNANINNNASSSEISEITSQFSMCKTEPKNNENPLKSPAFANPKIDLTKSISSKHVINIINKKDKSDKMNKITSVSWFGQSVSYTLFSDSDDEIRNKFGVSGISMIEEDE